MKILKLSQNPEYKDFTYSYLKSHRWDDENIDQIIKKVFLDTELYEYFIAVDDNKPIWMVLIHLYDYENTYKPWLWSLYVIKESRWKWVAWKLVKEGEKYVKDLWYHKIWLDTYQASKYYERLEHNYTYYKDKYRKENKYVRVYFKELN